MTENYKFQHTKRWQCLFTRLEVGFYRNILFFLLFHELLRLFRTLNSYKKQRRWQLCEKMLSIKYQEKVLFQLHSCPILIDHNLKMMCYVHCAKSLNTAFLKCITIPTGLFMGLTSHCVTILLLAIKRLICLWFTLGYVTTVMWPGAFPS